VCDGAVTFPRRCADDPDVWWIVGGLLGWFVLAALVAVVIGRGIRLADQRELGAPVLTTADLPNFAVQPASAPVAARRRRVPLPPVGVALAALGVALEVAGFLVRLSGAQGPTARVLSMDAPLSVPRMYITVLFAVSAVAALSGATRIPGRRPWWTAVGLVAAGICFVKAGGTVHATAMSRLSAAIGSTGATAVSALVALAVVAGLWYLARGDRRDRLRVLGGLAFYACAAVGLSAVSAAVSGIRLAAAATFVEESGEALGAVVFLVAVLVGVAPRLVLPADWALRRSADAQTLGVADPLGAVQRPVNGR
jgi:hypothetical protein